MGRPSKALITKENAVQTALDMIDEVGLGDLSLRQVAKKMGVQPASLYYHFKNKAELLADVARFLLTDPPELEVKQVKDWKEAMVKFAVWTRQSLMKHPNAAQLLLEVYPERIMLPSYEYWVQKFDVPNRKKLVLLEGLEKMTYGSAIIGAMSRAKGLPPFPDLDSDEYPNLVKVINANRLSENKMFEEAVRRYLSTF